MVGRYVLGGALALVITAGAADQAPPMYRRMKGASSGGGITTGSDATLGDVNAKSYTATDGGLTIPQGRALNMNGGNGASIVFDGVLFQADAGFSIPTNTKLSLNGAAATVYFDWNTSVVELVGASNGFRAGTFSANGGYFQPNGNVAIPLHGKIADGAGVSNATIDGANVLSNATAELLSLYNGTIGSGGVKKRGFGASGKDIFPTGAADAVVGIATLVGGTVTVSTTAVTAGSEIQLTVNTPGGTPGYLSAPTASIVAGTSFVINSSSGTDTSTVNWRVTN